MVFFIAFLRMLATCLITNSHYLGVYPTDIIANGGLLGDVIFFAVSGYCLYNVKASFPKWYSKRVIRCYLPVIMITAFYLIIGSYELTSERTMFWWFIYPTYYHFVSSIMLLYVFYYFIMKIEPLKNRIPVVMVVIAVVYLFVYIFIYDKSYYHIDKVWEPMIRFLFMESMLLGAWFRQNDKRFRNKPSIIAGIGAFVAAGIYFICKIAFSKNLFISNLQIINQLVLFVFLCMIIRTFAGLDSKLEKMPAFIKKIITFISEITLEIYLVQYVIIDMLKKVAPFPINWLVLTGTIFISATVLHYAVKGILLLCNKISQTFKKKIQKG